jgi:hypothetical protein
MGRRLSKYYHSSASRDDALAPEQASCGTGLSWAGSMDREDTRSSTFVAHVPSHRAGVHPNWCHLDLRGGPAGPDSDSARSMAEEGGSMRSVRLAVLALVFGFWHVRRRRLPVVHLHRPGRPGTGGGYRTGASLPS